MHIWHVEAHENSLNGLHLTWNRQIITTSLDHSIKVWGFTDSGNIWRRNSIQIHNCPGQIICSDLSPPLQQQLVPISKYGNQADKTTEIHRQKPDKFIHPHSSTLKSAFKFIEIDQQNQNHINPLKTLQPVVPKGGHLYSQSINLNFRSYIDLSESHSGKEYFEIKESRQKGFSLVKDQYSLLQNKNHRFAESQHQIGLGQSLNQSQNSHQGSPTFRSHLLAVGTKDLKVQIFPVSSVSPYLETTPLCSFKPRNSKITNFLKFYDSALYAFSGELLTVYDYAHQKIHQSKDLGKFTLSGKILQKNGLLACEMRHDVVKIFDSKTCNQIDQFEFDGELTGNGILEVDD